MIHMAYRRYVLFHDRKQTSYCSWVANSLFQDTFKSGVYGGTKKVHIQKHATAYAKAEISPSWLQSQATVTR